MERTRIFLDVGTGWAAEEDDERPFCVAAAAGCPHLVAPRAQ